MWILISPIRTVEAMEGFHLRYEGRRLNFTFGEDHSGYNMEKDEGDTRWMTVYQG